MLNSKMPALIAGTFAGMVLGAMFVATVCMGLEHYGGVRFLKEPLLLILMVGMPVGGLLGGVVGHWSVSSKAERRDPDDPA